MLLRGFQYDTLSNYQVPLPHKIPFVTCFFEQRYPDGLWRIGSDTAQSFSIEQNATLSRSTLKNGGGLCPGGCEGFSRFSGKSHQNCGLRVVFSPKWSKMKGLFYGFWVNLKRLLLRIYDSHKTLFSRLLALQFMGISSLLNSYRGQCQLGEVEIPRIVR